LKFFLKEKATFFAKGTGDFGQPSRLNREN